MERSIQVIPATRVSFQTTMSPVEKKKTAAYARVSTDSDEQFTSYEAQVDYYTRYIQGRPDWEFAGIYTDEGISGLGTKNREGFNRMIVDAMAGKIDLIITKSVSRFARNTVDTLVTVRKLKEKGIEVYFEKENIHSLDGKGELLLTIMSSLAQEESRSISQNVTWGQRKRFADGKVTLPYKKFLGYERGENKDAPPVINPEQAELIRKIYRLFMEGKTPRGIAKLLTEEGVPTPAGKAKWPASTVSSILQNEKYRGSARLQKSFTVDYLTKKKKLNEGEVQQYYIEHSHEPIIDPEEWDAVQEEIDRRKLLGASYSGESEFGSKLICGECGGVYGQKIWHSNDKYRSVIWRCNNKYKQHERKCKTPVLVEDEIKHRFVIAINQAYDNRVLFIQTCLDVKKSLLDTGKIKTELTEAAQELSIVQGLMMKAVKTTAVNDNDLRKIDEGYSSLAKRYEHALERKQRLEKEESERRRKASAIQKFIVELRLRDQAVTKFDKTLWMISLKTAIVNQDGSIQFLFVNGKSITI